MSYRADKQIESHTHRQTDADEHLTHATTVTVSQNQKPVIIYFDTRSFITRAKEAMFLSRNVFWLVGWLVYQSALSRIITEKLWMSFRIWKRYIIDKKQLITFGMIFFRVEIKMFKFYLALRNMTWPVYVHANSHEMAPLTNLSGVLRLG